MGTGQKHLGHSSVPLNNIREPRVKRDRFPVGNTEVRTSKKQNGGKIPVTDNKIPSRTQARLTTSKVSLDMPNTRESLQGESQAIPSGILFHIRDTSGGKLSLEKLIQNPSTKKVWLTSTENKLGHLSQGFKNCITAQDAMDFIFRLEVLHNKTVTYANFICDYRPLKSEPFRVRMTVGGDKLQYDEDTGSLTVSLLEAKLLANNVISDCKKHNSKFCAIDLKDFFLNTPMASPEYVRIHKNIFSSFPTRVPITRQNCTRRFYLLQD